MATYQLAGLPSFQTDNSNAPSAQPVQAPELAPKENLGVQLASVVDSIGSGYKKAAFQQAFGKAYASGDKDAMQKLAENNPDHLQDIQQGMGFIDQNNNQKIGQAAAELHSAALSNSPQAVQDAITRNKDNLALAGVSPGEAIAAYQSDPSKFANYANLIGVHTLGPKDYYSYQQNQDQLNQQGQIAGQNLSLKERQLAADQSYKNAQLQQNQDKINIDRDQGNQKLGLQAQNNNIQQQLADVRKAEAATKAASNSAASSMQQQNLLDKKQSAIQAYDNNVSSLDNAYQVVNDVKAINPDVFKGVFGFGGSWNSRINGTDSANAWSKITALQNQARVLGMQFLRGSGGSNAGTSNEEGEAAQKALLSINQGTDSKTAQDAIDNYVKILDRAKSSYDKQKPLVDTYRQDIQGYVQQHNANQNSGQQMPPVGYSENGYTFLGGDPSKPNNWRQN